MKIIDQIASHESAGYVIPRCHTYWIPGVLL